MSVSCGVISLTPALAHRERGKEFPLPVGEGEGIY